MAFKSFLYDLTETIKIIDTHEHMERTPEGIYPKSDLFDLLKNTNYLWADMVSSGMSPDIWDGLEEDDEKKWLRIREYLPNVTNTGYYQGIIRGLHSLYSFEDQHIDDSNWAEINQKIRKNYEDSLWPEKVLQNNTHIEMAINDVDGFNMNRNLFLPAIKIDYLLRGATEQGRNQIFTMDGVQIETFEDYVNFLNNILTEFKSEGAIALKTVTPYYRSLEYLDVPESEARNAFSNKPSGQMQKTVEDFAFHFIIRKAIDLNLPIQIHTGILAWNNILLEHCNPVKLNNLFLQYPKCRFILFHGGYPYTEETGALVKAFPNVYLDFCWLPWISRSITKRSLHGWLDLIPLNKFMWGGDANRAECVHGHWLIAQEVVVEVLNEKIQEHQISPETASQIIRGIFRNNAIKIFKLNLSQN